MSKGLFSIKGGSTTPTKAVEVKEVEAVEVKEVAEPVKPKKVTVKKPVVKKPVTKKPAAKKVEEVAEVEEKPKKPVAKKKPVTKKPVAKKAVAKKATTKKTAEPKEDAPKVEKKTTTKKASTKKASTKKEDTKIEPLDVLIPRYGENNELKLKYTKLATADNGNIKLSMKEDGIEEFEADGYIATFSVVTTNGWDGSILLELLKGMDVVGVTKTIEVVDMEAFEQAVENGEIELKDVVTARTSKPTEKLTIKKVK